MDPGNKPPSKKGPQKEDGFPRQTAVQGYPFSRVYIWARDLVTLQSDWGLFFFFSFFIFLSRRRQGIAEGVVLQRFWLRIS